MLFNTRGSKNQSAHEQTLVPLHENPKISFEFLPNGKVMPSVSWVANSNVNIKLIGDVINMLNEGKLYEGLKTAIVHQGVISGDIELASTLAKYIKDPKSVEDERPLIRAGLVTRFHFAQQGQSEDK